MEHLRLRWVRRTGNEAPENSGLNSLPDIHRGNRLIWRYREEGLSYTISFGALIFPGNFYQI
ncbi:MAG: hypothetical protein J0H55_13020 [Chitinophagaceae bacterium]|nr:hypothetical protein [Chitinophagaceae bacterium]